MSSDSISTVNADDEKVLVATNDQLKNAAQKVFHNMGGDIFTRLPVKSIYKFRSVSKHLMNLPLNNLFRKQQVNNMNQSNDLPSTFLLQKSDGERKPHPYAISLSKNVGIPHESSKFLSFKNTQILASSSGLLFCFDKLKYNDNPNEAFLIFNPITQHKKYIPTPSISPLNFNQFHHYRVIFECGNNNNNNDFFLVMMIAIENEDLSVWPSLCNTVIYSKESNDWELIGAEESYHSTMFNENSSVCLNGIIYYLHNFVNYVIRLPRLVAYDVREGTSKTLIMLEDVRRSGVMDRLDMHVFQWGKSNVGMLKILSGVWNLWVLEDMGSNSWKHIFERSAGDVGIDKVRISRIWGVRFVNETTILIVCYGEIYVYCFGKDGGGNRKIEKIQDFYFHPTQQFTLFPYSCSLRDV